MNFWLRYYVQIVAILAFQNELVFCSQKRIQLSVDCGPHGFNLFQDMFHIRCLLHFCPLLFPYFFFLRKGRKGNRCVPCKQSDRGSEFFLIELDTQTGGSVAINHSAFEEYQQHYSSFVFVYLFYPLFLYTGWFSETCTQHTTPTKQ